MRVSLALDFAARELRRDNELPREHCAPALPVIAAWHSGILSKSRAFAGEGKRSDIALNRCRNAEKRVDRRENKAFQPMARLLLFFREQK